MMLDHSVAGRECSEEQNIRLQLIIEFKRNLEEWYSCDVEQFLSSIDKMAKYVVDGKLLEV